MTIPKELTTVTSVSKILAAVLFIIFPFAGFYIGIKYEEQFTKYLEDRTTLDQYITKPKPVATQSASTTDWKTYKQSDFSLRYPQDWYTWTCEGFEGILFDYKLPSCGSDVVSLVIFKLKELDGSFMQERKQNVVISERNILIDGKTFIQAEIDLSKDTNEGTPPVKYISTKINVNNVIYKIDLHSKNERKIYDQILATFQFSQ